MEKTKIQLIEERLALQLRKTLNLDGGWTPTSPSKPKLNNWYISGQTSTTGHL